MVIIGPNSVDSDYIIIHFLWFGSMTLDFGFNLAATRITAGLANDNEILKFHTKFWILNQNVWQVARWFNRLVGWLVGS